jgi:hypothetical protein
VRAPFTPAHRGGSGPPLHGDVPVEAAELILGWTAR